MAHLSKIATSFIAASLAAATFVHAQAKVEEQIIGPVADGAKYVVSPRDVHLATVAPKGSRVMVVVDGVAGPKFDSITTPATNYVDPRSWTPVVIQGHKMPNAAQPAIFSRDGKHFAYFGQAGDEWVMIEDGKELGRMKSSGAVGAVSGVAGQAGNVDLRIQFSGDEGKHLLVGRSTFNGFELWVASQKWPGAYASAGMGTGALDPAISPDGEHIAYVAQIDRNKSALIIDGKDAGYLGDKLQWMPDSKHLVSVSHSPKGESLQIDGKPVITARAIYDVYLSPNGKHICAALLHQDPQKPNMQFLWMDGKPVPATLSQHIKSVIFSPDGNHYAALCDNSPGTFVVIDGKKGQVYQSISDGQAIPNGSPMFAPDSSKFVYDAMANGKWFAVTDDDESDAFSNMPTYVFSPDGKHLAIMGIQQQNAILTLDGKTIRRPFNQALNVAGFVFSPNGSRYAAPFGINPNSTPMFADGADLGITGTLLFSPDSKHLAIFGYKAATDQHGLFIDGKFIAKAENGATYCTFTPDSQHLYWMTRKPAARKDAPPGTFEFTTYLDGKPVARCDQSPEIQRILLPMGFISLAGSIPSWELSSDGSLRTIVQSDDGIKRVTITPGSDTTVDALIATADASPGKPRGK